jgi:hypothetical protein
MTSVAGAEVSLEGRLCPAIPKNKFGRRPATTETDDRSLFTPPTALETFAPNLYRSFLVPYRQASTPWFRTDHRIQCRIKD